MDQAEERSQLSFKEFAQFIFKLTFSQVKQMLCLKLLASLLCYKRCLNLNELRKLMVIFDQSFLEKYFLNLNLFFRTTCY